LKQGSIQTFDLAVGLWPVGAGAFDTDHVWYISLTTPEGPAAQTSVRFDDSFADPS
jgi:hypothetical protein